MVDKNQIEWEKIFNKYNVVREIDTYGFYDISSETINKFRESRLMCKHDFLESVPEIFNSNKFSILAIENGKYRIARTKPFFIFSDNLNIKNEKYGIFPSYLKTIDINNIVSESDAMDVAFISGMIEKIIGEDIYLTIRGRERSGEFSFELENLSRLENSSNNLIKYDINNVQIEIDGGYEGRNEIALFECKLNSFQNINYRQIIYPKFAYTGKYGKQVKSYFLNYGGAGEYQFVKFDFVENKMIYDPHGSIIFHLQGVKLISDKEKKELLSIKPNLDRSILTIPFPQADTFDVAIRLFYKFSKNEILKNEYLKDDFEYCQRQFDYYKNVLKWMGLIESARIDNEDYYCLSNDGRRIMLLTEIDRLKEFWKIIFANEIFNLNLNNVPIPDEAWARNINFREEGFNKSTSSRRLVTVRKWTEWFKKKLEISISK